eukprot:gene31391-37944_t
MIVSALSLLFFLQTVLLYASDNVSLQTDFVKVAVDQTAGSITELSADFFGKQQFWKNTLSAPILLQGIKSTDGSSIVWARRSVSGLQSGSKHMSFIVESFLNADDADPLVRESVSISITDHLRSVSYAVKGELLGGGSSEVQALVYPFASSAPSLTALTSEGVLQMMGKAGECLGLGADLERYFALGDNSTLEVIARAQMPSTSTSTSGPSPAGPFKNHVLVSSTGLGTRSTLQSVVY